ncbi:MAG: hypothetical protein Q8P24_07380, partial [Desulfobacterales bacterium]|nr:hypothetical protein [Desulfobacterales bacterium]
MKKMSGKNFIVIIMTIFVAVTLMSYAKADAQWEAQWQKTLAAGKKEGKVSVYVSSISPGVRKQAPIFAKQFGIELEVTAGRGNALLRRLSTEKKAGLNLADVVIGGGISVLAIKQAGVSGPMENKLILPEVIDPKLWYTQDRLPWLDDAKHFILFYAYPNRDVSINTDLVKPGEIQSWQDLLSPQFKGRIVWSDPTIPGSGSNGFCTNIMNNVLDENYYRKLVATQDITLNRDLRQM